MRLLTCGSRLEIPSNVMQQFEGIVGGYHWKVWNTPTLLEHAQIHGKTEIWSNFLYGNKHTVLRPDSCCDTFEEWFFKHVNRFQYVTHWVLVNEFTNDKGIPLVW